MNLTVQPASRLCGEATVPGDKSITHRALLLGGLSDGTSRIDGFLDSGDCRATLGCLQALGVEIERPTAETLLVRGRGLHGWREPEDVLDCVRSGTTMRLMAGLLAGQPMYSVLRAEAQLRRRPMDRVIEPLTDMGARIAARDGNRLPPLTIMGQALHGADHTLPVATAQVKSCLLLAGLYAEGTTTVREPGPSRDHTERMLRGRGVPVTSRGLTHSVTGPVQHLDAADVRVPGDFSSAAYLIVAALLVPGSEIVVRHVGVNPTRTGLLDALAAMGAEVTRENERDEGGEPVADLRVRATGLTGATIGGELVPRMIDEFPILALAATQAQGETRVRDAAELRVKETDRVATTVDALRTLGAQIEPAPDGFDIVGPTPLVGASVDGDAVDGAAVYSAAIDGAGDHRLAMTLAVAGLIARGGITVLGAECIADSFPGFGAALNQVAGGALQ